MCLATAKSSQRFVVCGLRGLDGVTGAENRGIRADDTKVAEDF
jgi:hypothetical protein